MINTDTISFIDFSSVFILLSVVTYNNKNQYANFQNQTYHQL